MIKKVDIAHAGQSPEEALILLETAISTAKNEPNVVAVKVVHGLGSGRVAEKVREWAKDQEGRFTAVIPGEEYDAFNKSAVDMRSQLLNKKDRDFNNRNPGITIFWL
ncbi:MAG: hypothetical protein ACJ0RN_01465 [Candidatus Neomarinimicrobiota bacterium]|tara:strand:+ start:2229 stop:2549 length:321 start_codon:yes stop_codon:yes gene_type:complete